MSQPAENTRSPAAVTMPTRSSGSSRSRTKAAPKRRLVTMSMALTLGRSSVTSSTCPRCSTLTGSLIPLLLLPRRRLRNTPGMGQESSDRPALAATRRAKISSPTQWGRSGGGPHHKRHAGPLSHDPHLASPTAWGRNGFRCSLIHQLVGGQSEERDEVASGDEGAEQLGGIVEAVARGLG